MSIPGYSDIAVTDEMGNFVLPAHAADGQIVQLRAQNGRLTADVSVPAGNKGVELVVRWTGHGNLAIKERSRLVVGLARPSTRRLHFLDVVFLMGLWLCLTSRMLWAEAGVLVVHVKDVQRRPISGVQIGVEGDGGSAIAMDDGKARIALAKDTEEKSWVSLQILKSPPGKDYVIVSPWDYRTLIPSFENESENFVEVVVVQRGDRAALESGTVLAAAAAQINKANAPTAGKQALQQDPKATLTAVAKRYGLTPDDLDRAIRAWGAQASDPYEAGLVALYERNYPKASTQLASSLQEREEKLGADRKAVADAAFFLGLSLYGEGKYGDSVTAYQRSLQLRPDDSTTLNNLAASLNYAGDYTAAESLYRRALAINEKAKGPDHPDVAKNLNNLAALLVAKGDYKAAEPLFRSALAIDETALGPDHPDVASDVHNLAALLEAKGDYGAAEPLARRALAIDEKALGPDHPDLAPVLNSLAVVLYARGDYGAAEPLVRRALAIDEKALGPDHPDVAKNLNNLARLLAMKGEYSAAEQLYRRALAIDEKALGPDHPEVARDMHNLSGMLYDKGDYVAAEPLARRALAIDEKVLGPDHPDMALVLNNLAALLKHSGDYQAAEPLYRRALAIDEKVLGPDRPEVATDLLNLAALLEAKGDYGAAEPLARRALAIDEKALGPDHPAVATDLNNLASLLQARGDYAAAESLYRRALAIDEKALGQNHPFTQRLRNSLQSLDSKDAAEKQQK